MSELNIFNTLSEFISLRINGVNEVTHSADWFESRKHPDYDLWFIAAGEIQLQIKDTIHNAKAGELVLFSPKVAYTATAKENGCKIVYTHFDFGISEQLHILDNFHLSGILSGQLVEEELLGFLNVYDDYRIKKPLSSLRLKAALTFLLAKIIEHYDTGVYYGLFSQHFSNQANTGTLDTLKPVFDYIQNNVNSPIRISDLANITGVSEKYFIAYFKKLVGVTPGRYIYQIKMNQARDMLYSKNYTIQEIAEQLGYPDQFSFSKSFKKYFKVSPSKFH
ncbi:AraC-type DNA-binding protein [Amphibacillus marinus]|uniref:AraC-type DNA-binding protein n=1 Tax=Amphibacillus marinus TaxID=872970 RepID=A0A1H8RBN6_9BACI|nr:AraC family transcriptional regulator [Amphibacillus marinus]SEO63801.1 AraC-type DNA-binding protein [Amphibacillus marinus]